MSTIYKGHGRNLAPHFMGRDTLPLHVCPPEISVVPSGSLLSGVIKFASWSRAEAFLNVSRAKHRAGISEAILFE